MSEAVAERFSRCGVLRGLPLSAFSSPILCGKAKNRHNHHRARAAVRGCRRRCVKFSFSSSPAAKLTRAAGGECKKVLLSCREQRPQRSVIKVKHRTNGPSGRPVPTRECYHRGANGMGPMSSRELLLGKRHALPHTEIGEIARASASISSLKVFGGVGTFFKKSPRRPLKSHKTPSESSAPHSRFFRGGTDSHRRCRGRRRQSGARRSPR